MEPSDFKVESAEFSKRIDAEEDQMDKSTPIQESESNTQKCTKEVNAIMMKYNCYFSIESLTKDGKLLYKSVLVEENKKR